MKAIFRSGFISFLSFFRKPSKSIHIINAHFVTPEKCDGNSILDFRRFMKILSEFGVVINIDLALSLIKEKAKVGIPNIALTFDDGFEECYTVIAPVLEEFGVRGVFFINANYVDSDAFYQEEYNKRINTFTKKPMSWKQIIDLHKRGHIIGSHTLDHFNLGELDSSEIEIQIKENSEILENKLNSKVKHFAWTYGTESDFSEYALEIVQKYHSFIFSAHSFKRYYSWNDRVLNRRHIEPFWIKKHIKYFLSFKRN